MDAGNPHIDHCSGLTFVSRSHHPSQFVSLLPCFSSQPKPASQHTGCVSVSATVHPLLPASDLHTHPDLGVLNSHGLTIPAVFSHLALHQDRRLLIASLATVPTLAFPGFSFVCLPFLLFAQKGQVPCLSTMEAFSHCATVPRYEHCQEILQSLCTYLIRCRIQDGTRLGCKR